MENGKSRKKTEKIEEFEKLAKENKVKRLDVNFLKRFLIGRQFDVIAALKAVQNFESFVTRRHERWLKLKKSRIDEFLQSKIVEILENTGIEGQHVVWIRVEKWDPQTLTVDEILEISGLLCELLYMKAKEVKYVDIIVDLHNFSLKHLYGLSPKFARRMVFFMSECLPMIMLHIYVVRQPKIFHLVYSLFKPFLEVNIRNSIKICGCNFESLHTSIGKEYLPSDLGGSCCHTEPNTWLNILNNSDTQRELKSSGYEFL